ncbi:MAG: class I SAM-dependent methyltransferase [Phycisphaerales bacterium]
MPYVDLLALVGEVNRPPGGNRTVGRLLQHCHLRPGLLVLHACCNTGFLTRELARRSGCRMVGVDISPRMVAAATSAAAKEGPNELVSFAQGDTRALSFPDVMFDVVLSGGGLAFVTDQERAVAEWIRVTRPFGLIADAELYYHKNPPASLRERVSAAIGVAVPQYTSSHWLALFRQPLLERYHEHTEQVTVASSADIDSYCARMAAYVAAGEWPEESQQALLTRFLHLFQLFNENLSYMSYALLVFKRLPVGSQPSLYV